MALSGIQIFKLTPKKNCKECGSPTCMAFAMKVAQGAKKIEECPYMSDDALAQLSEATAPPMKTIKVGAGDNEHTLGGETVLYRHEKTFVNKTLYAAKVCSCMDDAEIEARLAQVPAVDYERISERMYTEMIYVNQAPSAGTDKFVELAKKAAAIRPVILDAKDEEAAKAAVDAVKDTKPVLMGANASNYEAFCKIAADAGVVLGVSGTSVEELYDTVAALEKLGNKNLIIDVTLDSIKATFEAAVLVRRTALKDNDRTFGYPSIVNLTKLTDDKTMEEALVTLFTMKYGSIVIVDKMDYATALPLYGLRQNLFTDPQKPMKVAPGIYPLNGADENSVCLTTVDFALTYFLVSGELERSGVPVNLVISDAGGLSVLTSWAAGKFSSTSISKYFLENVADKVKSRKLIIPGKVAVLKGDLEAKLPGWEIVVAPLEAVQLVKFLKDMKANGEI